MIKSIGIYKITNPKGSIYVGQSMHIERRFRGYKKLTNCKGQTKLYNSLVKYGTINHTYEVIELCEVQMLNERERFWQEHFNSVNEGLNCFLTKTDTQKKVLSEETKKIMSQKASGVNNHFYGKKHSEESKLKISERSSGENNPNYGGKFKNDEWLMKQRISNSKKHLKVIDTLNNEEYVFINSKDVGNFLSCDSGRVRTSKKYGWKIYKRYIIEDLITET